jgi:hypothetical protein
MWMGSTTTYVQQVRNAISSRIVADETSALSSLAHGSHLVLDISFDETDFKVRR